MENNTSNNKIYVDYDISKYTQKKWFDIVGKIFEIELEGILEVALYNKELTNLKFQVKKTPGQLHRYTVKLEKNMDLLNVRWVEEEFDLGRVVESLKSRLNRRRNTTESPKR